MKDKLLRIGGALLVSGFLYGTTTFLHAQEDKLPITPPITPPTVTVTPTNVPSVTPTVLPTITPTLKPTPATQAKKSLATGGVMGTLNGNKIKLNFNAFGVTKVAGNMGKVIYSNSDGINFKGDVNLCYYQEGSEAAFAGTVTSGSATEAYFLVKVQDNGEGRSANPDIFGVWLTDVEPLCTLGGYPVTVTNGNLQVR